MLPLAIGGLTVTAVIVLVLAFVLRAWWSTPLFGFGAGGPDQPIVFSHMVHVDEAGINCEFCHRNVSKGDAATIPAVEQCLFCHKTIVGEAVDGQEDPEIVKLLAFAGFTSTGGVDSSIIPEPVNWERVHRLPDHVQFSHEPHIRLFTDPDGTSDVQLEVRNRAAAENITLVEAACTICHGVVRKMEKVKQERSLKMGDCVDCHRDNDAPTDCVTCHY